MVAIALPHERIPLATLIARVVETLRGARPDRRPEGRVPEGTNQILLSWMNPRAVRGPLSEGPVVNETGWLRFLQTATRLPGFRASLEALRTAGPVPRLLGTADTAATPIPEPEAGVVEGVR